MTLRKLLARAAISIAVLGLLAGGPATAAPTERILDFYSQIRVHADGTLTATEAITVVAAGSAIKRGIYRDFPTTYRGRLGSTVRVGFDVVEVLRDGRPESYRMSVMDNGIRVYIGDEDRVLEPGTYTYTLTYIADRQLGFFEDFDELYWNITGNGWAFPIVRARATVELPPGAPLLDKIAYTGAMGAKGRDFKAHADGLGNVHFTTTRTLNPGEGLTIAVSWPKGYVTQPTTGHRVRYFVADNTGMFAGLAGLAVLFLYYLFAWLRVGRDPKKGPIVPLFAPPKHFSPAAVRFVTRMGFDHKAFAASVVDMAVKGYLKIGETVDGDYSLEKTGANEARLSPGERKLAKAVFGRSDTIELKTENHEKIGKALKALKESLRDDFEKIHFVRNLGHLVPGAVLTTLSLIALAVATPRPEETSFMVMWLTLWTMGCAFLGARVVRAWRNGETGTAMFMSLFAIPFFGGEAFGLWHMAEIASPPVVVVLLLIVLVNILFYELLKAPTVKGRKVMDEIEGFKQFLSVVEKERLGVLNPPDRTPDLFEKYLPFALALDVAHKWSEQFADVLAAAGRDRTYSPHWYSGSTWSQRGAVGLADRLGGAFAGAIASSSSPPGSSSGGGGGGFSGGGGGGGGGGGW